MSDVPADHPELSLPQVSVISVGDVAFAIALALLLIPAIAFVLLLVD